jgi:hypothetical protein
LKQLVSLADRPPAICLSSREAPRVSIVDHEGKLIGRFGDTPAGTELGKFLAPHGLAVDSRGDIYVGEVSWTAWPQIYPGKPHPADLRSLQKFERVE